MSIRPNKTSLIFNPGSQFETAVSMFDLVCDNERTGSGMITKTKNLQKLSDILTQND